MNRTDQQLITEAYKAVSFKQTLPSLSLSVLNESINSLNETQLNEATELLNELLDGLKSIWKGAKNTAASAWNVAKNIPLGTGRAVLGAASQVGGNIKDLYKKGQQQAAITKQQQYAAKLVNKLVEVISQLQNNPDFEKLVNGADAQQLTLTEIQDILNKAVAQAAQLSQIAQKNGIFGGAGKAAKKRFFKAPKHIQAPATAPVQQPVAQPTPLNW